MFKFLARYVTVLLVFLSVVISVPGLLNFESVNAAPEPEGEIYVQDPFDYLTEKNENWIIELGKKLEDYTTAQISVLIVDNLEDQDIESYAKDTFKEYKLGKDDFENGVLILISIEDDEEIIEVGRGLKEILTDEVMEEIFIKYARPYFKYSDYDKAVTKTYAVLYNKIGEEYGMDKSDLAKIPTDGIPLIVKILIVGIIPLVAIIDVVFFRGRFFSSLINTFTNILSPSRDKEDNGSRPGR